ncbi:MAG: hypothetical protein KC912_17390 [Proteobacteria bacterium]|nr:hypothetical protein [Pseudomonadota bacterium]
MVRYLPWLLLTAGCAKTVTVEVPTRAAVDVEGPSVAVVAGDPACRSIADRLTQQLGRTIHVDPRAETRIAVVGCNESLIPTVSIHQDGGRSRGWEGRSSALVVVEQDGVALGRLIGTGGDGAEIMPSRRGPLRGALRSSLIDDVADQIAPSGLVDRRIYPAASPESPRGLETRAIAHEALGNVSEALDLATAAHSLSPSPRLAAYVGELERRLHLSD